LILVGVSCIPILDLPTKRLDRTKRELYHNPGVTSTGIQSSQEARQCDYKETSRVLLFELLLEICNRCF
jgi:hypothetical protein